MRIGRWSGATADASGGGWLGGTSTLGHVTLAVLAFGAGALLWKQLPDLRRYLRIRSM